MVRRNLEADAAGGGSREFAGVSAGAGAADVRLHTPDAEVDFDERASEAGGRGCESLQHPLHCWAVCHTTLCHRALSAGVDSFNFAFTRQLLCSEACHGTVVSRKYLSTLAWSSQCQR